jgi:hypothetical protein
VQVREALENEKGKRVGPLLPLLVPVPRAISAREIGDGRNGRTEAAAPVNANMTRIIRLRKGNVWR